VSQSPLLGIRVLDVGTRLAAPFCAGLLGELGAEVIKVEQPGTGDMMRSLGPFVPDPDHLPDPGRAPSPSEGYSLFWAVEGRGRRSVTLDLHRAEGQEVFRKLASQCDVVCENFRPGTLERWHIAPEDLDPKLVIVRISVFGQDGPYNRRGGLDRLGIAYGGLLNLTGYVDRPPVRPGLNVADYMTGVFAAHAAIAALYERDARGNGRGEIIDAALYAAVLRVNEWTLAAYDRLGVVRQRYGNRMENSAPIDNYLTADGTYICIVAGSDNNFKRLCEAMGRADLLVDPRFQTASSRAAHGVEINDEVGRWVRRLPSSDVERRCLETGVPVAPILDAAGIFADAHIASRGDLTVVDDPVVGPIRQQAPFPRLGPLPRPAPAGAPLLGQHTRTVLAELCGLDDATLDNLAETGII
jgi:crotonobetainyl-CoA:carnitine CoA-transferase CaiB-like acyl-CoA transferase